MEAPEWFVEQLKAIDPCLNVTWNPRYDRWQVTRTNPKRPNSPPAVVKTVALQGGGFMPLDRRTLAWLRQNDCYRKSSGMGEAHLGRIVQREIDDQQSVFDKAKAKANLDRFEEAQDKFAFAVKRLERKGLLYK